jgi:3-phosphoshikimate 1-carboxyvinyltransferase
MSVQDAYAVSFHPVSQPIVGRIAVPGSKSLTNRALICAAMARGTSRLTGVLDSEDTRVMVDAWRTLGLAIDWDTANESIVIEGCAGKPPIPKGQLHIANSGTSIRFLTAALAATYGEYVLDGVPRMRERPIRDLMDGLRELGANVTSENDKLPNCPPVRVVATGLRGGVAKVAGSVSSQFLSGMMMASPYAESPVTIRVTGELVSRPYVDMTAAVMAAFGVELSRVESADGLEFFASAPVLYTACEYAIESDASGASYFMGAAAITGGTMRIDGLSFEALQGDVQFARVVERMGCKVTHGADYIEVSGRAAHGVDVDMNAISDTVQTLAAVALFADGPTRVHGVAHNRHKETDRIGDLACELRRLGARVDVQEDGLTIHPGRLVGCDLHTYRDHRMAMSLSLVGLQVPGVRILDPKCTAKTYPEYFEDMGRVIGQSPRYESRGV